MQYIIILLMSVICLHADMQTTNQTQDFDTFLKKVLKSSPYLNSSKLGIKQSQEAGTILNRSKNPSLELEASYFSPDIGSASNGMRAAISQPIRLWGVADANEQLASAKNESAKNSYTQKRALFIKNLSLLYVRYTQKKKFLALAQETEAIAQKIYEISNARYESGTIAQGIMLQSKIDYEMIDAQKESIALEVKNSYFQLLKYAGVANEVKLDSDYVFKIATQSSMQNPDIQIINSNKKQALSQAEVTSNKIEWLNLYAEYENEPDQDIARVGVNIPLAIFNTRSQEKQIALLEAKKSDLLSVNETKKVSMELKRVQNERTSLTAMASKYKKLIISQMQLLEMFQKAYKIANINLLALQDVKNRVITTKKALININIALNKNAILTNYIQGNYNE